MRDNAKGGALTEVTFFVLLALYTPRHGYAIIQFVEERTAGRLTLGAGSLYGAISTLAEKNWIEPLPGQDGRKREYIITPKGRAVAWAELERLRALVATAGQIVEVRECGQEEVPLFRGLSGAAGEMA